MNTTTGRTVYLDTANWIDLAEGQVAQEKFESAVEAVQLIPILSFIHLLEFAHGANPANVARYVDRISTLGSIRWIKTLHALVEAEAKAEYLRHLGMNPAPIQVFGNYLVDVLRTELPWYDKAEATTFTIENMVKLIPSSKAYGRYCTFRESSPATTIQMRDIRGRERFSRKERSLWTAADLPPYILTPNGLIVQVNVTSEFLKGVDLARCPASAVRLAFFEGESLSTGGQEQSDVEDLFHLVGPMFCEISFADKRTIEKLHKGEINRLPRLNSSFKDWVQTL